MRYSLNDKKLKRGTKERSLFGFFFCCNGRCRFLCDCAFGCAFGYDSEFCDRRVRATSKRVAALSAFPDADAFTFNPYETALGASVRFLQLRNHFYVSFSHGGAVSRS